jgi:glycosyltransferase involved in cell wall biosynthesis
MKILHLHTLYKPYNVGGAEKICELLVVGFKEKGLDNIVLTTGPKNFKVIEENINEVRVIRVPIKNIYWHYNKEKPPSYKRLIWHLRDIYNHQMYKEVKKILLKEKPDIAILHNITGFSSSIWKLFNDLKIPIIQVLHDLYSLCPNSNMFNGKDSCKKQCLKCKVFRLFHPKLSQNVDAVVGVSKFVLDKHLEYGLFKKAKIKTYIHNVLKIDELPEIKNDFNKDKITFGFIGGLTPAKGIENLLKVFKNIDLDNIQLLVAGKGKESYEKYLKDNFSTQNIKFLGYIKSDEFFKDIDVLVVPSLWNDTLPTVILESFIYGVPVIGSKRGGIPELINNKNGYLFEPTNLNELKEIILSIVKNKDEIKIKNDFILKNREKYIDYENWVNKYLSIVKEILNER